MSAKKQNLPHTTAHILVKLTDIAVPSFLQLIFFYLHSAHFWCLRKYSDFVEFIMCCYL